MPYPANYFDVMYGHSVFTHLAEKDHFNWLMEVERVLKPGGFGFFTVCTEPGVYITRYNPTASLILLNRALTHLSATRTSRQCVNQGSPEADTQRCD